MLTPWAIKSSAPGKLSEEERKKAERLAKLQAWKAKQVAEKHKEEEELKASGGTRYILEQMDKRDAELQALKNSAPEPALSLSETPVTEANEEAPAQYSGKFDPKIIAKKATTHQVGSKALGDDVAVPQQKAATLASRSKLGSSADGDSNPASEGVESKSAIEV